MSKNKEKKSSRGMGSRTEKEKAEDTTMIPTDTKRFDSSKPQFREDGRNYKKEKVVLDERFSSVLTDPRFQLNVQDKYGRKKKKKQPLNELSAFYEIDDSGVVPESKNDDERDKDASEKQTENPAIGEKTVDTDDESSSNEDDENDDDDEKLQDPASRIAYLTKLSRGELDVSSSSDDDSDDDDDEHDNQSGSDNDEDSEATDEVIGKAGVLDPSSREEDHVELTTEESPFLAVMNMDWSHVRAVDIFAVVSSFVQPGTVKSVQVYASDFGIEQMEKEERFGPKGLWKKSKSISASNNASRDGKDDDDGNNSFDDDEQEQTNQDVEDPLVSDFDPAKLRKYEASRLKYFFAVVEMASSSHAERVYKEVDGLEFEHSSAALDVRSIPVEEVPNIVKDRPKRDEAKGIPSNYEPPEFVVSALQQTNVQCTWEAGDRDRERTLTKYAASGQDWRDIAESDDIKAYLGSDASSDEEGEVGNGKGKASRMRKMLGLDSGDENENSEDDDGEVEEAVSDDEESNDDEYDKSGSFLIEEDDANGDKEISFVPGAETLEDQIRSAIDKKKKGESEPTPWEKYLEKRKEKRKQRKAEARAHREEINQSRRGSKNDEPKHRNEQSPKGKKEESKKSDAELELLMAGAGDEEEDKDYDIRGLQRLEQNKTKKLKGARKRKEAALEANLVGTNFKVDMQDDRFSAVLDGKDDRFGIDRTDPNFKETPAMREIMAEQTRRRKKRKTKTAKTVVPDVSADSAETNAGASALSSLVSRLKQKVPN